MTDRPGGLSRIEKSPRAQSTWITAARGISAILTMAIPLVLVRVLDQTTFGHYKQLFLIADTALPLLSLAIPQSLYYLVPRYREDAHRYQVQSGLLLVATGVLGGVALLALGPWIGRLFDAPLGPYLPWIALFAALSVPASLIPASPMVDRRAPLAASLVLTLDTLRSALLIGIALWTRSLMGVVVAAAVAITLQAASVGGYLLWRGRGGGSPWRPTRRTLRVQLAYALQFAAGVILSLSREKVHAYFVAANFTAAEFAIYAVATLNIPLIARFSQTVGEVVVLENAEHFKAGRSHEMRRIWYRATRILGLALIPVVAIGEAFAPDVIELLFGAQYLPATPILRVFLLGILLQIFLGDPVLRATGDLGVMIGANAASLAVTVGVLLLLVGPLGPLGAVTSLIAGRATFALAVSRRTARRLDIGLVNFLPWRVLGTMLLLAGAAGAASAFGSRALGLPLWLRIFGGGGLATAMYGLVAWFGGLVPPSEKDVVRRLTGRVRDRVVRRSGR